MNAANPWFAWAIRAACFAESASSIARSRMVRAALEFDGRPEARRRILLQLVEVFEGQVGHSLAAQAADEFEVGLFGRDGEREQDGEQSGQTRHGEAPGVGRWTDVLLLYPPWTNGESFRFRKSPTGGPPEWAARRGV